MALCQFRTKDRRSLDPGDPKSQSYSALLGVEFKPLAPHPASPPPPHSLKGLRQNLHGITQAIQGIIIKLSIFSILMIPHPKMLNDLTQQIHVDVKQC